MQLLRKTIKDGRNFFIWMEVYGITRKRCLYFLQQKEKKDITVFYIPEKVEYQIASTDMHWRYSDEYNVYVHDSIKEALKAPWQHWNFVYEGLQKKNKQTI